MTQIDLTDPVPPRRGWLAIVVWTMLALIYAALLNVQIALPLSQGVPSALIYFYGLALVMIPVRDWSRRLLESSLPRWQQFVIQLGIAVLAIAAWSATQLLFHRLVIGPRFWQVVYADNWIFQLLSSVTIYGAALGLTLTSLALARDRERTRRAHELEVTARDAQLLALKAQFQPHFVLNSLNSLLALIDSDPALARKIVVRLADLMKAVFDRVDVDLVPLDRELDLVRAYLDVEQIRLGERLSVEFDVDDAARQVLVPPFLLQPVVENAVKHGVSPFAGPGRVEVTARVDNGHLTVVVRDHSSRSRAPVAVATGTGRGLQITRRRLDGAYGHQYQFSFAPQHDGAAVEIRVPTERAGAA